MAASASALTELARLTSADPGQRDARPLHVRLSHFEHGAALSLQLFGFAVLPATGEPVIRPTPPGMAAKPPAAGLRPPEAVSAEDPLIYAVIANHSVPVQIEHTLATLAMLVARQELISGGGVNVPEIGRSAVAVSELLPSLGTCSTSAQPGPTWPMWPATHSSAGTVTCRSERFQTRTSACYPQNE